MKSPYASDDDIARIGAGFLDRSLPREAWTHAAHFAATLWLMRHRPDIELGREMRRLICAFNEAKGGVNDDTTGYHETITQASRGSERSRKPAPIRAMSSSLA
jgi:hypothetical protein